MIASAIGMTPDDAQIVLKSGGEIWHVSLDGQEVLGPTFQRCFNSEMDAVQQTLKRLQLSEQFEEEPK